MQKKYLWKYLGWFLFIIGCLALLNSLILLNFLLNWMPSWFFSPILIVVGAILLRLKIRSLFGILFGLLAIANIVYCIIASSTVGIFGVIILVIISGILLRKGLFDKPSPQVQKQDKAKVGEEIV